MVKCHADSKVEDSKLSRLFFTLVSHLKYCILKKNVAEPVLVRVCAPLRACVYICVAVLYINTHAHRKWRYKAKGIPFSSSFKVVDSPEDEHVKECKQLVFCRHSLMERLHLELDLTVNEHTRMQNKYQHTNP